MPGPASCSKRAIAAIVLLITAMAVGAGPSSASAEVEVVKPVHAGAHALTFDLEGVHPAAIHRAASHVKAVRYRLRRELARYGNPAARASARKRMRQKLHRRVRVSAVREAAESGGRIRVSKPTWAGRGVMKLGVRSGASITSGPSGTITTTAASFEFGSVVPGGTFQCRLDGSAWSACTSPKVYSNLADGRHTFEVQAIDAGGAPDASPATRSLTVDTNPDDDPLEVFNVNNIPDPSWNVFNDASPWNTRIDRSDVAAKSDVMIEKLLADGEVSPITTKTRQNWGTPIYFADPSDPLYAIDTTHNDPDSRAQDGRQVRMPAGAEPSQESDGVMWIVDQESGWINQVQRAAPDHSAQVISSWKSYRFRLEGNGFPDTVTGAPTGIQPIRPEELAAGSVNHTMSMGARCLSGHPVAPYDQSLTIGKTCAGDTHPATTRLSMGNVVFLDMSHSQIDALGVPTWQEAILKGLADHGAVVGLNGGSAWSFKFENPIDRTSLGKPDPYAKAGLPATLDFTDALDSVGGWGEKLKVLEPFERP